MACLVLAVLVLEAAEKSLRRNPTNFLQTNKKCSTVSFWPHRLQLGESVTWKRNRYEFSGQCPALSCETIVASARFSFASALKVSEGWKELCSLFKTDSSTVEGSWRWRSVFLMSRWRALWLTGKSEQD